MLYREIIAVCSEIHTKHINTVCGQNVELLNVKLAVHHVPSMIQKVERLSVVYFVSSFLSRNFCEFLIAQKGDWSDRRCSPIPRHSHMY